MTDRSVIDGPSLAGATPRVPAEAFRFAPPQAHLGRTPAETVSTHHFTAMGSTCSVSILCSAAELPALATAAERRAADLEAKWSRFRPDSELSRLNLAGSAVLSHDTMLLVDHLVAAWKWTDGLFDPTVLDEMVASGYGQTFSAVAHPPAHAPVGGGRGRSASPRPTPGCGSVRLDLDRRQVELPPGCGLDPGGLGKGLAADLLAEELIELGAPGTCVSMGGDLRALGAHPGEGWPVGIADPVNLADPANPADPADPADSERVIAVVLLDQQGLATSNRTTRTWLHDGELRSHLLRPSAATGGSPRPLLDGRIAASVLAGQAWWAEALTKVAMVGGPTADARVAALGGELLSVESDSSVTVSPGWGLS